MRSAASPWLVARCCALSQPCPHTEQQGATSHITCTATSHAAQPHHMHTESATSHATSHVTCSPATSHGTSHRMCHITCDQPRKVPHHMRPATPHAHRKCHSAMQARAHAFWLLACSQSRRSTACQSTRLLLQQGRDRPFADAKPGGHCECLATHSHIVCQGAGHECGGRHRLACC
ncbi:hypothetical protein COO60DRAFT_1207335 [Scenedesmus sp. NREL 46B-D3]|nr:hypothetical protein COO60DRAFT_1207335 [Scenedesmus sp. NREL 46B-D3]